jgi:hypothetical protein
MSLFLLIADGQQEEKSVWVLQLLQLLALLF